MLGAVLLALLSLVQAGAAAYPERFPAAPAQAAPFVVAPTVDRMREGIVQFDTGDGPVLAATDDAVRAAEAVYRSHPLSKTTLTVLLLDHAIAAQPAEEPGALAAVGKVGARDRLLQTTLLVRHLQRDDDVAFLERLDAALVPYRRLLRTFEPALARAFEDPRNRAAFAELLRADPPWLDQFFQDIGRRNDWPTGSERWRLTLGPEQALPAKIERSLIGKAVQRGAIGDAYDLYRAARGAAAGGAAGEPLPPFDWELDDRSGFYLRRRNDGEAFDLFVKRGRNGTLARRWIGNEGRRVRFAPQFESDSPDRQALEAANLQAAIRCVPGGRPLAEGDLRTNLGGLSASADPRACPFFELELRANAPAHRGNISGRLENLAAAPS